jgi:hypothetical protein
MGHVRWHNTVGTSTHEKGIVMIMDDDFFDWFNEIEDPLVGHIGEPNNETNGRDRCDVARTRHRLRNVIEVVVGHLANRGEQEWRKSC